MEPTIIGGIGTGTLLFGYFFIMAIFFAIGAVALRWFFRVDVESDK